MDEYISRQDALLHSEIIRVYSKDYGNIDVVPVEYLADIPAADVQPVKHGRWILCDDGYVRCSECNCKAFIENDETIITDFCHGCGTDMRMDGDSEI